MAPKKDDPTLKERDSQQAGSQAIDEPVDKPVVGGEDLHDVDHPGRETRRAENADQGAQEDGTQNPPPA